MARRPNRKPVNECERDARRNADRERIEQAARDLLTSEGWQRWIKVRVTNGLGRYSLNNQLIINMVCAERRPRRLVRRQAPARSSSPPDRPTSRSAPSPTNWPTPTGSDTQQYPRAQAEVLVDCVTYCVLGSVGLDVGGESIPYGCKSSRLDRSRFLWQSSSGRGRPRAKEQDLGLGPAALL